MMNNISIVLQIQNILEKFEYDCGHWKRGHCLKEGKCVLIGKLINILSNEHINL